MNTNELNDLFGLTEDESQKEVVDPLQQEEATDEGTEYVSIEEDIPEEPDDTEDTETVEEVAPPQQTPEENHNYAAARKAAEAENRRIQEELDALKGALAAFGYEGTGREIADLIEANRTGRDVEEIQAEREAQEAVLEEAISHHPAIQQAQQMIQELSEEKTRNMIDAELRNINAINPEIRTLEDLNEKVPNKRAFEALVKDGMHIDEAYKMVTSFEGRKPSRKQDTKSHLRQVNGSNSGGPGTMPADVYALAKQMMPKASKEEIIRYYEKNYK